MKFILILFFLINIQLVSAQGDKKPVVRSGITRSKEKSLYFENDSNGNMIYSKNTGMNGPITMIFASEYDSLNREIKSFWVHSNLGFYLSEKVYEESCCIKTYDHTLRSGNSHPFGRETLNKITSLDEFTQMKVFEELQNGERRLSRIDLLDSSNNLAKEIYVSNSGDTTAINYYKYNSKKQEIHFHMGTIGSEAWTWDIYYLYDENGNKIRSTRVSSSNETRDTTEIYNYYYNESNQITSENYYYKNAFRNKTEYFYKSGQLVEELFYEAEEFIIDAKTIYKYDKKGNIKKKIVIDHRSPKKEQKEVFKTKLKYW